MKGLSGGVEAGFEGCAGGAADSPVEGADVNQGDFHCRRAVVVFGETQGLSVHRADGAEGDGDAVLARVLVYCGVDRALDAAAAPLRMHEIAVTNGLAGRTIQVTPKSSSTMPLAKEIQP